MIFGKRADLLADAKERIAAAPGKYFEDRVYGEHEAGGTQVLYLSHVPFEKIGLPKLGSDVARPLRDARSRRSIYRWLSGPILVRADCWASVIKRNWKRHEAERPSARRRRASRSSYERARHDRLRASSTTGSAAFPSIASRWSPRRSLFFAALAAVGLGLALVRLFSPLGPFSGMNDVYAWGIWKTFNVMTLTALGSGAARGRHRGVGLRPAASCTS